MSSEPGELTERIAALEAKLRDSENHIAALKFRVTKKVAFTAKVFPGQVDKKIPPEKTLICKTVITNVGNSYDPETGVFTAPYTGIYCFIVFHRGGKGPGGVLYLYHNNIQVVQTIGDPGLFDMAQPSGNSATLALDEGDVVYLKTGPLEQVWGSGLQTTFSGFLISSRD